MIGASVFAGMASLAVVLGLRHLFVGPLPKIKRDPAPRVRGWSGAVVREGEQARGVLPHLLRRMEDKAIAADVSVDLRFVVLLSAAGAVALWTLAMVITGQAWLSSLAALAGVVAPGAYLNWLAAKRAAKTEEQFERLLRILSQGMRAGLSLQQALQDAEERIPAPLGLSLRRLGRSVRQGGAPLASAIAELGRGTPPRDMQLLLGAMRLHIETGAALPIILDSVSQAALRRRRAASAMRAATSLGRTQANILVAMPLILLAGLRLGYPGYLDPLFNTPGGRVTLVFVLGWLAIGYVVMQRMMASSRTKF